jgi:predicted O-methyltransferase YrrM
VGDHVAGIIGVRCSSMESARSSPNASSRELGDPETVTPGGWTSRSVLQLLVTAYHVVALPSELAPALEMPTGQVRDLWRRVTIEAKWGGLHDVWLYSIVRLTQPTTVVETGVHFGRSTAAILRALHENGSGHLYSIDLPIADPRGSVNADGRRDFSHVDRAEDTGREVPEYLRGRWTLSTGDAKELLHPLLERVKPVDLFFHDSEHSYAHQMFEYTTAWPALRSGGFLASDDVGWSAAFQEFSRQKGVPAYVFRFVNNTRGILRKP